MRGTNLPAFLSINVVVLLVLAGCGQMYWTRRDSNATLDRFTADHRECLVTTGAPVQDRPGYVVATEQNFRVCMAARNWHREQWTSWDVPRGRFRSLEDFPTLPVQINTLPEQSNRAGLDVNESGYYVLWERCIQCPVP